MVLTYIKWFSCFTEQLILAGTSSLSANSKGKFTSCHISVSTLPGNNLIFFCDDKKGHKNVYPYPLGVLNIYGELSFNTPICSISNLIPYQLIVFGLIIYSSASLKASANPTVCCSIQSLPFGFIN